MSVQELHSLPYEEYMGWYEYFSRRPVGWKDDLRAYYIMGRSGMSELKAKPEEIFPSIKALKIDGRTKEELDSNEVNQNSFIASPLGKFFAQTLENKDA